MPGGIDVHTHMELPFGGTFAKDTFETGTRAAAFGGTTSIVDFAVQSRGASLRAGLDAWHAKAEGNAVADYGFHMIMSDVNDDTLAEMDGLVAEGVPDFKLFTAYPGVFYSDDGAIFRAMQQTARNGGLIMMHAENGMAIDVVAAQTVDAGTTDPIGHGLARKAVFEGEATNRVIRLAEAAGVPVYIVHLSAKEAMAEVRAARDRGSKAYAETCPQYLFLSLDDLGHGFDGAKFVCSPPLRTADHQDDLWNGLVKDDLQIVSTDHCPFDFHGQKELGRGDFRKIPNGLPGVEDRVDLLHDGGVVAGLITRERWVEIISTAPARMFGMYPQKGAIAIGSDADLVVYDPNRRHTISATTHHMDVDYSCYEGRSVQGGSDIVLSRGSVIVRNGEFTGRKGAGRFIKRAPAEYARAN
jgi:dihydropyrimidinase